MSYPVLTYKGPSVVDAVKTGAVPQGPIKLPPNDVSIVSGMRTPGYLIIIKTSSNP